jgi:hypothetical protein
MANRSTQESAAVAYGAPTRRARVTALSASVAYFQPQRNARTTEISAAVIYDPNASAAVNARATQLSAAAVYAAPDTRARTTELSAQIAYDPERLRGRFRSDGRGSLQWDLPLQNGAWQCDGTAECLWLGYQIAEWNCDGASQCSWNTLGAIVADDWDCQGAAQCWWDSVVTGPVSWQCDGAAQCWWLNRIGAIGTPCISGDGQPPPGEQNYVF